MVKKTEKSIPEKTIEQWQKELGIEKYKHAGAVVQAKWGKGKVCTETEYKNIISEFLGTSLDEKKIRRK